METPLVDPLGIGEVEDVNAATRLYVMGAHPVLFYSATALALAFSVLLGYAIWLSYKISPHPSDFDFRELLIALLPLLLPIGMYEYFRSKVQTEFFEQVAASLGFSYSPSALIGSVAGTEFEVGHNQRIANVMMGMYKNYPARLYNFSYTIGYGKSQRTETEKVFELTSPTPLPHTIVNLGKDESAPHDVETVTLEGDFNSFFNLYVSRGSQMEIREIFQPDTMQMFVEQFKNFRMEIFDTKIYLFGVGALTNNRRDFLAMQTVMDSIFDTLIPSLKTVGTDTVAAGALAHDVNK